MFPLSSTMSTQWRTFSSMPLLSSNQNVGDVDPTFLLTAKSCEFPPKGLPSIGPTTGAVLFRVDRPGLFNSEGEDSGGYDPVGQIRQFDSFDDLQGFCH
jgi:hypothetical protein